ncbi:MULTISPECIES: hypothetical protein [Williamsia]|uniref:hypothetical protein n=1 Tax=Williamsia TaxID=85043 RepID=UPI0003D2DA78|nr:MULTISPECIES: hypothetical protein [Williamsia]ETD34337.1 hypothetical protein W823_03040 [Williamsia sp. D3]PVY22382.1 hypothetical protein C7458_13110 [Williamsia marianensis]
MASYSVYFHDGTYISDMTVIDAAEAARRGEGGSGKQVVGVIDTDLFGIDCGSDAARAIRLAMLGGDN